MIFFPNCKINIGLDVLRRRSDGFHEVDTLMYPVRGLTDVLEIVPAREPGVQFSWSGLTVDCPPEKNLCMKAYELMAHRYDIGGVRMHLHKVIPFGAGLGGGSADAAFVVKGLNELFGLGLTDEVMERLAAELGSDTPFFIRNVPQYARGRGEVLSEATVSLKGKRLVLVKPDCGVSTAQAYAGIIPALPPIELNRRIAADMHEWKQTVSNGFEPHIFQLYPRIAQLKTLLYDMGALYASMSGSGSAVYGIFEDSGELVLDVFNEEFVYQEVMM